MKWFSMGDNITEIQSKRSHFELHFDIQFTNLKIWWKKIQLSIQTVNKVNEIVKENVQNLDLRHELFALTSLCSEVISGSRTTQHLPFHHFFIVYILSQSESAKQRWIEIQVEICTINKNMDHKWAGDEWVRLSSVDSGAVLQTVSCGHDFHWMFLTNFCLHVPCCCLPDLSCKDCIIQMRL